MALSKELDTISDYFVLKSLAEGRPITNKKVQKLAYYTQAWSMVFNDGAKAFPESIEAWMHGPAIRSLWHKYNKYGYSPISSAPSDPQPDTDTSALLDEVWRVYGKHDADYLEALTHGEDPWLAARAGLEANEASAAEISTDLMRTYYASLNGQKV